MPTYQYRCTECGVEIERVQKFSDPALTVCEDCGGALRKVYNAVGIVFKGSGFYATDNRSKGATAAAAGSKTETKPEPKSDSKPEASGGSKPAPADTSSTSTTKTSSAS
ncbi:MULTISPECIES: FmdB family zinc ribbon protein [unclassified Luteococcus]|uniref:FmdB family zinc ribbon protein n=1 Tax=unclassified Luteococcus TaxID=2639923 RepID=UPI00313DD0D5